MIRSTGLPLLPGYSYNTHVGQTRFHKSQHFEHLKNMPILSEKEKPGIGGYPLPGERSNKYPSVYARAEVPELPAWLAFDKQVLAFDAYFQETAQERKDYAQQVRKCKIYFFLEDGTTQVMEEKVPNSGIKPGALISRQRIPYPPPRNYDFYDILDFNIGRQVELYGRVFMITNCDAFTRQFCNRCGIAVPDAVATPPDPYTQGREVADTMRLPKKPNRNVDTLGQFLKYDRQVLNFDAYWDDRESDGGSRHELTVQYYLADDTIEILEKVSGNDKKFLSRVRLAKGGMGLRSIGQDDPITVLNVLTTGFLKGRFVVDPLKSGQKDTGYYSEADLLPGCFIIVYGRRINLISCDKFTQEYYRVKYGINDFSNNEPIVAKNVPKKLAERELPPWNGFGSHEDSAKNCRSFHCTPLKADLGKFIEFSRVGLNSHILRFKAELMSKLQDDALRDFIVSFHLADDTVEVCETAKPNTGFTAAPFFSRTKIVKYGQDLFTPAPPECYTLHDFYVGNTLNINNFLFRLVDADEYAYRYMELHESQFPKSDISLILGKIRHSLQSNYNEFIAKYWNPQPCQPLPYCTFRRTLKDLLGNDITEQEIITVGRYYSSNVDVDPHPREKLRAIAHGEMKKALYNDLERLEETFRYMDAAHSGYISREHMYATLRGAKLPISKDVLNAILDKMARNTAGEMSVCDLLRFLDYKHCPAESIDMSNVVKEFGVGVFRVDNMPKSVDVQYIVRDLALEGVEQKS